MGGVPLVKTKWGLIPATAAKRLTQWERDRASAAADFRGEQIDRRAHALGFAPSEIALLMKNAPDRFADRVKRGQKHADKLRKKLAKKFPCFDCRVLTDENEKARAQAEGRPPCFVGVGLMGCSQKIPRLVTVSTMERLPPPPNPAASVVNPATTGA